MLPVEQPPPPPTKTDVCGELPDASTASAARKQIVAFVIAVILAMFFAAWAMRGANTTEITLSDQARHAMNGVALFDMVREGKVLHAIGYLREYFGHLPSLSMPYHPPLFPAVEAL